MLCVGCKGMMVCVCVPVVCLCVSVVVVMYVLVGELVYSWMVTARGHPIHHVDGHHPLLHVG
jgi:hypothetical protein